MYINKLKRSMVLPTERDQRDMSMRRHKLFSFFSLNFFCFFFLKISFFYDYVKRMFESLVRRLSLYIIFSKFLSEIQTEINCKFEFDYFIFLSQKKKTERHSLLYFFGFCFILCLNFKIATSRISSCCA